MEKRCCGRKTQLYKSKSAFVCHRCHYHYDWATGKSLGYFGRGVTKAQWDREAAAWAKAHGSA